MTQYDTVNVKLSNSQLNTLESRIKNDTEVTLNLWLLLTNPRKGKQFGRRLLQEGVGKNRTDESTIRAGHDF